jgi:hypothetical protein
VRAGRGRGVACVPARLVPDNLKTGVDKPNRQTFHLVPSHVWMVAASRAQLGATDLGRLAPLPRQATIGDLRIPQKGLLAFGALDLDPFSLARHSARTARS